MIVTITIETADELARVMPFLLANQVPTTGLAEYPSADEIRASGAIPVAEMSLSARTSNALQYGANIWTADEIMAMGRSRLLKLKHIGYRSISEIEAALAERGLTLPA